MSVGNAKVGIFDPEKGEEAVIENGGLNVNVISGGGGGGTSSAVNYGFYASKEN